MGKLIFISYRREDTPHISGRIYDRLVSFSNIEIFKDVDSIPLGVNFKDYLYEKVSQCDFLLALIGSKWINITDENGKRRLDNPRDFVRIEIEAAIKRAIPIIPLFVDNTEVRENDLPESIRSLLYYNGMPIRRDPDFHNDVDKLAKNLGLTQTNFRKHEVEVFPDFTYMQENTYSCSGITNKIKEYRHNRTEMEFVLIPGGSFMMGSNDGEENEKPVHKVTLKPFLMSKHVVTQGAWQKIMGLNLWKGHKRVKEGAKYPAVCISWDDCKEFCKRTGLSLPSEAQWEYACRAGTQTNYYWGDEMDGAYCWYADNSNKQAHSVGEKSPNAFGLYDILGNVLEWCEDSLCDNYNGASTKGSAMVDGTNSLRVSRGGRFDCFPKDCRCARRGGIHYSNRWGGYSARFVRHYY